MAEHYTLSGLISTSTIQKFSAQFESTKRITQAQFSNYASGQTSIVNSYVAGEPPINSRKITSKAVGGDLSDTRSSSGSTQGKSQENATGNTASNGGGYTTSTTRDTASTGYSRGDSNSQSFDSSNSRDELATELGGEGESRASGSTATRAQRAYSGSHTNSTETRYFSFSGSGAGFFTTMGTSNQTFSAKTQGSGYTSESGYTYQSQRLGGASYANGGSGTTVRADTQFSSGTSTAYVNPATGNDSGTASGRTTGTRQTFSDETTTSSVEFRTSTYSYSESFLDTVTTEDTVFANSDTTITAKKTTFSSETSSMDLTADTISSESVEVAFDPSSDTISFNVASTFTIFGNAGFVTTNNTGEVNMLMTNMAQSMTSPGLKPSMQNFEGSIIGGGGVSYTSSYTFSNAPTDSIGSTTTISLETREANYSSATNESYLDDGETRYSTRLIPTTTSSYYQTTYVSTRSRGRQYLSSTITAQGSFETVNSFLTKTIESVTPVIYFDGTNLLQTENREIVRVSDTGTKQFPFAIGVFGGSTGLTFNQTLAKSFIAPGMDPDANRVFSTSARPHNYSAIETIFNQEKAFIQQTDNETDILFGKQFPPILKSSGTTTEGDSSAPSTTTTSGTYISGLGSIRRHISLMFTDSTFKIPNFQQSGDTGRANGAAFTVDEEGGIADINYRQSDKRLFRGVMFIGGKNNVETNGILTAEGYGKFKIGSETITLSSNETFSTLISFGTMKKIENSTVILATEASRTRDFLGRGIVKSDLNGATNF